MFMVSIWTGNVPPVLPEVAANPPLAGPASHGDWRAGLYAAREDCPERPWRARLMQGREIPPSGRV